MRYPYQHDRGSKRRRLGKWIQHQRTLYRQGQLLEKRIKQLEQISEWNWSPRTARWNTTYERVLAFVEKNEKFPTQYSQDEPEKILGTWIQNRRRAHRNGTLPQRQVEKLEQISGWSWKNALTKRWQTNCEKVLAFVRKNGRLPYRNSEKETTLANWVHTQRENYQKKRLSQQRIERLEQIPRWSNNPFSDQWDFMCKQVSVFVKKYQELPKEKSLKTWISVQRRVKRKKRLSQQRIERLEQISKWTWDPHADNWGTKYSKISAFVKRYKRLPSQNGQDQVLGCWIIIQRQKYKKGKLSSGQIKQLEAISGWFWSKK